MHGAKKFKEMYLEVAILAAIPSRLKEQLWVGTNYKYFGFKLICFPNQAASFLDFIYSWHKKLQVTT